MSTMSKTKTLVLAVSVLTSLAATGLSAGSAQAREDLARIAVGEFNPALDRAEYTSFRRFYFRRFDRFDRFDRFGRGFGWGRF